MSRLNLITPFNNIPNILLALLLAFSALSLSGCFHNDDDDDDPTPDADPTGYYINTGDVQGGSMAVNDLQAMVYDNRILMVSAANELLYDGTITNITGDSFSADFTIYTEGEFPVTVTANGTIITGASISGTLNGSGVGSGMFTLLYAMTNGEVADVARIENTTNETWGAKVGDSGSAQEFIIDNTGMLTEDDFAGGGIFAGCELDGNITPFGNSNLYSVSVILTECDESNSNGTYTGLATSRTDATTDDTLVFAAADGRYSLDGDFKIIVP